MQKLAFVALLGCSLLTAAFGQLYAGERFSIGAGSTASLNGGLLEIHSATAFTGNLLPAWFAPSEPELVAGTAYSVGPHGQTITYSVTVTYNPHALPSGVSAATLRLYQVVNDEWVPVSGSGVNTSTNQVTGTLTSTATFGVLSSAPPTYEGKIYYRSSSLGDVSIYRFLPALGEGEPILNMVGLTLAGSAPGAVVINPARNGIGFGRLTATGAFDLYSASIDGSNAVRVGGPYANVQSAAFSGDGTSIYLSVQKVGSTAWNVVKIVLSTGVVTTVHAGGSSSGPAIGNGAIAFADSRTITTITAGGTVTTFSSPTADGNANQGIDVSYDGTKVIWATNDGAIYSAKINGTSITKLIPSGAQTSSWGPRWSPDGTMFAARGNQGAYFVSLSNLTSPTYMFQGSTANPNILFWR